MKQRSIHAGFWITALFCLFTGLLFGLSGGLQYILPRFLKDHLDFARMRPLHVFLITQWISCAAAGSMYYFIQSCANRALFAPALAKLHLLLQVFIIMVAASDFFLGRFTGREYMEFPAWIILLMIAGWIFAAINFIGTLRPSFGKAPVYVWGWATGILFFIITLTEASLWQLDHFNSNIIRDLTVQWKALGSMVGAWNMLIYGSAMYVMTRISGDETMAGSREAFLFYFLGLTNLMFNWGHHTYVVPASPVVKNVAYIISMTELAILFNMIRKWSRSLRRRSTINPGLPQRLLETADRWIILNLILAIAISVPAVNVYTHGTHITVAHAMGATIGINTTILLATGFYIYHSEKAGRIPSREARKGKLALFNLSLLVFWLSLIGSGIVKAAGVAAGTPFYEIMQGLKPWFHVFTLSGFVLCIIIIVLAIPLVKHFLKPLSPTIKAREREMATGSKPEPFLIEEMEQA